MTKQLAQQGALTGSDLTQFQAIRSFVSLTDLESTLEECGYSGREAILALVDIARNSPSEKVRMQAIAMLDRKIQQTIDYYVPKTSSALTQSSAAYAQTLPAAPLTRAVGSVPPSSANPVALVDKPPAVPDDSSSDDVPPSLRGLAYSIKTP